jgi:hypothetical protein
VIEKAARSMVVKVRAQVCGCQCSWVLSGVRLYAHTLSSTRLVIKSILQHIGVNRGRPVVVV